MPVHWHVRRAVRPDVPAIVAVQNAAWRADFTQWVAEAQLLRSDVESEALWRQRVAAHYPGCAVLVATVGSRVAGFVWSRPWTDTEDLPLETVKLNALYVDPVFQSRGLGSALMSEAESLAATAGCRHGALWVIERNVRARRFYERHGWRPDEDVTKLWRGLIEVRYRRDLSHAHDLQAGSD
jgi:GNAT superfamily N-acetyltransferase